METDQESITVSEEQAYKVLNFHPSEIINDVQSWLDNESSTPLVLRGLRGIGRNYVLNAACYQKEFSNRPFKVVTLDMNLFSGDENIKSTIKRLEKHSVFSEEERIKWADLVKDILENTDLQIAGSYSLTTTLTLAMALKVYQPFSRFLKKRQIKLPSLDGKMLLQEIIELAAKENNVVINIQNSSANIHNLALWQDITETLDHAAVSENYHGRVMLAISTGENSSVSDSLGKNFESAKVINFNPYALKKLKAMLSERFENNNFDTDFLKLIMFQGAMLDKSKSSLSSRFIKKVFSSNDGQVIFPSQIVNAFQKLIKRKILQYEEGGWKLDKDAKGSINTVLAMPLREHYQQRFNAISESLQPYIKEYMFLASLCGKWIPQRPLLEIIGVEDTDNQDEIINEIEKAFVDCVPPLLEKNVAIFPESPELGYQLVHPLLMIRLQSGYDSNFLLASVNRILDKMKEIIPINHNAVAGFFWSLASQSDERTEQEWRELLNWHINIDAIPFFKKWLKEKLDLGLVLSDQLIIQATKMELTPTKHYYLDAVTEVCDDYHQSEGSPITEEFAFAKGELGLAYHEQGQFRKAYYHFDEALNTNRALFPSDHIRIAINLQNIGSTLISLSKSQEAISFLKKALDMQRSLSAEGNKLIAGCLIDLGRAYHKLWEVNKATNSFTESLKIIDITPPPIDWSFRGTVLDNMGLLYSDLSQYQKALDYHLESLDSCEKAEPINLISLADRYNNLAYSYSKLNKGKDSLKFNKKALILRKNLFPSNHPCIADSLNNVALDYQSLGNYVKAAKLFKESLNINEVLSLEKTHKYKAALNNLALLYSRLGDNDNAIINLKKALIISKEINPENHPDIAFSYNSLGSKVNDPIEALELHKKALKIYEYSFQKPHHDLIRTYYGIAQAYKKQELFDKALKNQEKALELVKEILTEKDVDFASNLDLIGCIHSKIDDHEKALSYQKQALKIRKEQLRKNHPNIAESYKSLGETYLGLNDYKTAQKFFKKAVDIFQQCLPKDHEDTIKCMTYLSDIEKRMDEI